MSSCPVTFLRAVTGVASNRLKSCLLYTSSPITEGDNGELVRPKAGGAVLLALHPNASAEVETRPEQQVSQALCYEAVITLDMTDRWAASWSRATVLIKISLEDKFVYNDRLRPSTRDKNLSLIHI